MPQEKNLRSYKLSLRHHNSQKSTKNFTNESLSIRANGVPKRLLHLVQQAS